MRGKAPFVALSGVDGAGKSTQIALLCEVLRGVGRAPDVLWARGGYTSGVERLKWVLRRVRPVSFPDGGLSSARTEMLRRPFVRKAWLALAIIDLLRVWTIGIRFRRLLGHAVVADRYVGDTLIDFTLNFPTERVREWRLWKLLSRSAPKPDVQFVLIVSAEESERRSMLKNEPFPDPPEIRRARLKAYEGEIAVPPAVRLDGTLARERVSAQIAARVMEFL